jgi:hypothetical protein
MRIFLAVCGVIFSFLLLTPTALAQTQLTGKMAIFNYMLSGDWSCTLERPALNGEAARSMKTKLNVEVVPDNVLHIHSQGDTFSGDRYVGYSTTRNVYWSVRADSSSMSTYEESPDAKAFSGSVAINGGSGKYRDTYMLKTPNRTEREITWTLGGPVATGGTVCSK